MSTLDSPEPLTVSPKETVWGVDVSTKRLAVAFHGRGVETVEFDKQLRHGARFHHIHQRTVEAPMGWRSEFPPFFVWVEAPTGPKISPPLLYAVGAVMAGLYWALEHCFPYPVEVRTISVGEWKKGSVGHGNASKAQVLAWARGQGYEGDSEDEADAWGVAHAGAVLLGKSVETLAA
jgi:hypothetical protein